MLRRALREGAQPHKGILSRDRIEGNAEEVDACVHEHGCFVEHSCAEKCRMYNVEYLRQYYFVPCVILHWDSPTHSILHRSPLIGMVLLLTLVGCGQVSTGDRSSQSEPQTNNMQVETGADISVPDTPPKTIESLEVVLSDVPLPVSLSASGTIIVGSPSARRLRIVTDPACSYCQEFTLGDQRWLEQTYVASEKLAFEIVYLPMDLVGALNAKALLCSAEQDQFVAMEHSVAVNALQSEVEAITRAKTLGLSSKALTTCLRSKKTASTLVAHERIADAMQVTRVPSFAVGAERWMGIEPRVTLQEMIEREL